MYPEEHPSLSGVVEGLLRHLDTVLSQRDRIAIGVVQPQLVVEGVLSDARNPVLADLARRLHDHELGAISFSRGAKADELHSLLAALGRDAGHGATPLGLIPEGAIPTWRHVHVHPVGYEHLRIRESDDVPEGAGRDRGMELWLGLARVSMAGQGPLTDVPDPSSVAQGIRGHRKEAAFDQAVVGYLRQISQELRSEGAGRHDIRRRVSRLISELDQETLARLIDFGGSAEQQRQFVLEANESFAAESVLKVLQAAATSSRQTISHSMTRLLTKLATHTQGGSEEKRERADSALRENVEALLAEWTLEDPNPDAYTLSLDAMARSTSDSTGTGVDEAPLAGPERLIQMGLELDTWGPTVAWAVDELVSGGETGRLIALLRESPTGSEVARRAWSRVTTPDELHALVNDTGTELESVKALAFRLQEAAVEPLLEVLAESDVRGARRRAFDALTALRSDWITAHALDRLSDPRWFVQRNMLALVLHFRPNLKDLDLRPWATHEDPRVRREALALLMAQSPEDREEALHLALADADERVVGLALTELAREIPEAVVPDIIERVLLSGTRSAEVRTSAVRVLANSGSPRIPDALAASVTAGRTIFGRTKLAAPTPWVIEALCLLAARWSDHHAAAPILALAADSKSPELRAAATYGTDRTPDPVEGGAR